MEAGIMIKTKVIKALFAAMLIIAAAVAVGCGGRGGSGGLAAQPPANPADRGTLKLTNVASKTVVTIDGDAVEAASGTISVSIAPGVHSIVVSRAGYLVDDAEGLTKTPVTIGQTTEKALSFTREEIPLPEGWVEAASRMVGNPE